DAPTVVVLLGNRVECGMVVNGGLVRGAGGSAGEIGHLRVAFDRAPDDRPRSDDRCQAGHLSCLETLVGTAAVLWWLGDGTVRNDLRSLGEAMFTADADSESAERVLERAGAALGQALAALENVVNPRRIVVYGPAELIGTATTASKRFKEGLYQENRS